MRGSKFCQRGGPTLMFFMSEEDQNSDHDGERHAKDSLTVNAGLVAFFFGGGGGGATQAFCILKEARAHLPPPPPLHPNIPSGIDYSESVTAF